MFRKHQNTVLVILGLVVLVTILTGCAAKKTLWGGPDTGYILSYRIAPQTTLRYELFTKSVQTMEMMGQSMENTSDNLFQITYTGRGTNVEKNLLLNVVLDSATMSFKGMGQERSTDLSSVEGKPFVLIVSPLGKEIGMEGADSLTIDFGAMAGGKQSVKTWFRSQFPSLPDHPVKVGETWTSEDVETRPATGMEMKVTTLTTNKLEGIETVGGEECFKVTFTSKGTMEGSGEQMGAQISMEAELEGKGTWYFAYKKGIYTDSNYEMFFEGTVAVTGPANMTIPINGTVTTTSKKIM